jgi:hypothetical protein
LIAENCRVEEGPPPEEVAGPVIDDPGRQIPQDGKRIAEHVCEALLPVPGWTGIDDRDQFHLTPPGNQLAAVFS